MHTNLWSFLLLREQKGWGAVGTVATGEGAEWDGGTALPSGDLGRRILRCTGRDSNWREFEESLPQCIIVTNQIFVKYSIKNIDNKNRRKNIYL